MYEDSSIETKAFKPGAKILCIASAGCTSMDLAPNHCVVAIDINPAQLAYARRRRDGAAATRGLAERVMSAGRALAPVVGWSTHKLELFLDLEDPAEQIAVWERQFNTLRFRMSFDRLMSVAVLKNVYASPFLQFLPAQFGFVLRTRMQRCFSLHPNRTNPYARALLLGELPAQRVIEEMLPIEFVEADVADFLEHAGNGSFDGFALSNILDGATEAFSRRLLRALERVAAPDAIVVIRSFREPREQRADNLAASDRSMLWGVVEAHPLSMPSQLLRNAP
jgi:S-adenosylmethionine:diacylglycerol 3-amino-3-carboxypropyl transferase